MLKLNIRSGKKSVTMVAHEVVFFLYSYGYVQIVMVDQTGLHEYNSLCLHERRIIRMEKSHIQVRATRNTEMLNNNDGR